MPTPSNNAPDSQPQPSYGFSSCPDADDQAQVPLTPSGWRPPPPYPSDMNPLDPGASQIPDELDQLRSVAVGLSSVQHGNYEWAAGEETRSQSASQDGPVTTRSESEDIHKQNESDEDRMCTETSEQAADAMSESHATAGSTADRVESSPSPARRRSQPGTAERRTVILSQTSSLTTTQSNKVEEPRVSDTAGCEEFGLPDTGSDFSNIRVIPLTPSSYLRPGSKFHGTQQSERQVYDVQVEIKHVDLRESFLCGYLRIQGLTEDHPTLTTYFEGEIIGSKYGFITQHPHWGATEKIDLSHWAKFTAFRPYVKQARKGGFVHIRDVSQRENIFMRWKEHFLVPDHRVRTINGASFEGFYYICFNQMEGEVSGIYFHSKSERFQQLELKHVEDRGCFSATEFR